MESLGMELERREEPRVAGRRDRVVGLRVLGGGVF